MTDRWLQLLGAIVLAGITGFSGWAWAISGRVTVVEERQVSVYGRILNLESGRSAATSAETIARFESVLQQIDDIKRAIERLTDGQEEILRNLINGPRKKSGAESHEENRGG